MFTVYFVMRHGRNTVLLKRFVPASLFHLRCDNSKGMANEIDWFITEIKLACQPWKQSVRPHELYHHSIGTAKFERKSARAHPMVEQFSCKQSFKGLLSLHPFFTFGDMLAPPKTHVGKNPALSEVQRLPQQSTAGYLADQLGNPRAPAPGITRNNDMIFRIKMSCTGTCGTQQIQQSGFEWI